VTPRPEGRRSSLVYYAPAAVASLVLGAIVVAIHRESLRTLVSAHGLLHVAIAQQFRDVWWPTARPENPFFAGEALPYYWVYHYVAARIGALFGIHPLHAFEVLGLVAIALVWFAGAGIARALGWRPAFSLAIGFLALAGTNAFGAGFLLIKLAAGRPWPADDGAYLWGLTHPVMGMARWNDPGALYGPLVNFYLNNSSRALALALVLCVVLAFLHYLQRAPWLAAAGLFLATLACTALSPPIGLLAAMSLTGVLGLEWIATRSSGQRLATTALMLVAGCVLPLPSYVHLLVQSGPGVEVGLRPGTLVAVLVSVAVLAALAAVRPAGDGAARQLFRMLTVAGLVLVVGSACMLLPSGNDSNLFHVGSFMLAVPAAAGLTVVARGAGPMQRVTIGVILVLLLSTPSVVLWSYWRRPPLPLVLENGRLAARQDSARAGLYDWIRATTPPDAVLLVSADLLDAISIGNVPEIPAVTGRALFVSREPYYMAAPHPDMDRRLRIADDVAAGRALDGGDARYVAGLGRSVFLLVSGSGDRVRALESIHGAAAFHRDGIAAFRVAVTIGTSRDTEEGGS